MRICLVPGGSESAFALLPVCGKCAFGPVRGRGVMSAGQEVRRLGAADVRAIAARLGVRPTKKLGQNFVVEPGTVRQIAALAGPFAPDDVILEVGPGLEIGRA